MTILTRWGLAVASAALMGAYAYFPALAFVGYICLVPWVVLYTDGRKGPASFWYYAPSALLAWILTYNFTTRYEWYAPVVMGLVLFVFWLPFAPILSKVHHRLGLPRSISVPIIWVFTEWLRAMFTLSHFDSYALGYTQARFTTFIQVADIVGVYGLSFIVAAVNGLLADIYFVLRDSGWSLGTVLKSRRVVSGTAAIAAVVAVFFGYGWYRLGTARISDGPRVALIQPNIEHTAHNIFGVHLTQLLISERDVPPDEVDLIIWPENAILDVVERQVYRDDLSLLATRKGAMTLVGGFGRSMRRPGRKTNTAYLVDRNGTILDRYDKQMLFPWTEYVPGDDLLGRWLPPVRDFHRRLIRKAWGYLPAGDAGDESVVFDFPWRGKDLKFSCLICFENVFPPIPAEAGRKGADFFVNLTSEGRVPGPAREQTLRVAIFRAVENRVSYVRVGNNGISGVIDPLGRLVGLLTGKNGSTINVEGVLLTEVPVYDGGRTFYTMSHDAFVWVVSILAFSLLVASLWKRRRGIGIVSAILIMSCSCTGNVRLGDNPDQVESMMLEGMNAVRDGSYGDALESLPMACATEEGCRQVLPVMKAIYLDTGRYEQGVVFFDLVQQRFPDLRAEALLSRGKMQELALDNLSAVSSYRQSIELLPSAGAYVNLGKQLHEMGRMEEGLEVLEEGYSAFPDDRELGVAYGRALRLLGKYERSTDVLEAHILQYPSDVECLVNLGMLRYSTGDKDGALLALRGALRLDPKNLGAHFAISRIAYRDGDMRALASLIGRVRLIEAEMER